MYTSNYLEKKTFAQYDNGRIIGYLNERTVTDYVPETMEGEEKPEPTTGYEYTGTERDGGTVMACADPTNYGDVTNAIIRATYSASEENAIQRHYINDPVTYQAEWDEYNAVCESAKKTAKAWLGIEG